MDRRGQSRSPKTDPRAPVTVGLHAADALAVLDEISPEPAVVLGSSIGAVIGLRTHCVSLDTLRGVASKIVPIIGRNSRSTLRGAGSAALAQALGLTLVEVPGGHGGYTTHPTAFAATLCDCPVDRGEPETSP